MGDPRPHPSAPLPGERGVSFVWSGGRRGRLFSLVGRTARCSPLADLTVGLGKGRDWGQRATGLLPWAPAVTRGACLSCVAPSDTIQDGQSVEAEEASALEPADGSHSALPGTERHPGPTRGCVAAPAEPSAAALQRSDAARSSARLREVHGSQTLLLAPVWCAVCRSPSGF